MAWQQTNGKNFRKSDSEKLRNAVNRYNRKLARVEKKYTTEKNSIVLPDKLYVKDLKNQIQTRKDLNNFYKTVDEFMKRGSEELQTLESGVKITKFQKENLERNMRTARRNLNKEIKMLELEQEQLNRKRRRKTTDELENRFNFNLNEISRLKVNREGLKNIHNRKKNELESLIVRINKFASESFLYKKKLIYKQNYLKALENVYGYADNYNRLSEELEKISPEEFYKSIAFDDIVSDIKQYYQAEENSKKYGGSDLDELFERVESSWKKVIKEKNLRLILKRPQTQTIAEFGRGLFAK